MLGCYLTTCIIQKIKVIMERMSYVEDFDNYIHACVASIFYRLGIDNDFE